MNENMYVREVFSLMQQVCFDYLLSNPNPDCEAHLDIKSYPCHQAAQDLAAEK